MTNVLAAFVAMLLVLSATPASAGGLSQIDVESGGNGSGLRGANAVALSPDGAHLYVASDSDDAVAVLTRDTTVGPTFGEISFLEAQIDNVGGVTDLKKAQAVAVSPDGAHVYAAANQDDAVVVFSRNTTVGPNFGKLTFVESQKDGGPCMPCMRAATGVAVSPDGAQVYVTGEQDSTLTVFSRNTTVGPNFGKLTFIEVHTDDTGGDDGLRRAQALAISGDGKHVYVAAGGGESLFDNSVTVFSRETTVGPNFGKLTFLQANKDGEGTINGLATVRAVAVSADGKNVYSAAAKDNSVAVFSRDTVAGPNFGKLTFVESQKDGGVINGLNGTQGIAVSPDGGYVYATGRSDAAMAVFRRSATTGALAFLEALVNDEGGVSGIRQPMGVTVSPDSKDVYVAGRAGESGVSNSAVVAFAVDQCGNGTIGPDEQCDDGNVTNGDGCSSTCHLELCGPVPIGGCRKPVQAGKGFLKIKDDASGGAKDLLIWKWNKGATTPSSDYNDPTNPPPAGESYVLCVYDGSIAPQPRLSLAAPGGGICDGQPCWTAKTGKFKYKDKLFTPDGFKKALLKEGLTPGSAKIQFIGKGTNLFFTQPTPGQLLPPSGLTGTVTVQLRQTDTVTPVCWDAVYSTPTKNDGAQYKAKSDP